MHGPEFFFFFCLSILFLLLLRWDHVFCVMIDKGDNGLWYVYYSQELPCLFWSLQIRGIIAGQPGGRELRNHSTLRKHHLLLFLCDKSTAVVVFMNVCLSMIDWSEPVVRNPSVYQSISTWLIYPCWCRYMQKTCIWLAIEPLQWTVIGCTAKASLWTRVFQNYHWIVFPWVFIATAFYHSVARVEPRFPLLSPPRAPFSYFSRLHLICFGWSVTLGGLWEGFEFAYSRSRLILRGVVVVWMSMWWWQSNGNRPTHRGLTGWDDNILHDCVYIFIYTPMVM